MPAGLQFVSATPSQGTYDSTTGLWNLGTVAPGVAATLQIQARVISPAAQTNTAAVSHSDQFDPNPTDNTATVTETPQQADLGLTKTVSDPTPAVGDTITFTVTLTNHGPGTATSVVVADPLPAGLSFVSAAPSQGTYDSATGLWTVGTVAVGAAPALQIKALVVSPIAQTNVATIRHADQLDPVTANDTAGTTATPQQADLELVKTVDQAQPPLNTVVTFTLVVTNRGPDPATDVVVSDPLPAGLSFVSAAPSQGTYDSATGVWAVGTLPNGVTATLRVVSLVARGGTLVNTASVSEAASDPDLSNNRSDVTLVAPPEDFSKRMLLGSTTAGAGDLVMLGAVPLPPPAANSRADRGRGRGG